MEHEEASPETSATAGRMPLSGNEKVRHKIFRELTNFTPYYSPNSPGGANKSGAR